MINPRMNTRDKRSVCLLAVGLVVIAAGVALGSSPSIFVGLFVVALTVRYRKKPPAWEYVCFLALVLAVVTIHFVWAPSATAWRSPVVGALPLMLSYVLDYLDERKHKRARAAKATMTAGVGLAEQDAAPNGGPAVPSGNSEAAEGPPSVS
jgi:hypothetical protein